MAILMAILFRKPLDGECPNVDLDVIKTAAEKRQQNSSRLYLSMYCVIVQQTCSNKVVGWSWPFVDYNLLEKKNLV